MLFIVYSRNAELVCGNSTAVLPEKIPEVSAIWPSVTKSASVVLAVEAAVSALWLCKRFYTLCKCSFKVRRRRIPTSVWIVFAQGVGAALLSVFCFHGAGAHHPRDYETVKVMIFAYGVGGAFIFLSASLWLDSARRLVLTTCKLRAAHKAARFNVLVLFAGTPAFAGAAVTLTLHSFPEFRLV